MHVRVRQARHEIPAIALDHHSTGRDRHCVACTNRHDPVALNEHCLPGLQALAVHRNHVHVDESDRSFTVRRCDWALLHPCGTVHGAENHLTDRLDHQLRLIELDMMNAACGHNQFSIARHGCQLLKSVSVVLFKGLRFRAMLLR